MSGRAGDFDAETELQHQGLGSLRAALRRQPKVSWTDARGAHVHTLTGRAVAGSAESCDLVVADAAVSRIHAELEPRDDGVWVRDLGSTNGTWVEGLLVGHARVNEPGRVRVGSTDLAIGYEAERAAIELWPSERFGPLLGKSFVMRELFAKLAHIAQLDSTVLLQGETGTGKELVARALHEASPRKDAPYVIVDCAALPENLLEVELFGHAKGAYTGAIGARAGAIESADGGTVFLDEVGELPLAMQPKLLRAIESRMVRRVGETKWRQVDVRFISATHRDLRPMVNAGAFREDLYFRLAVLPITVPPLRARPEDIDLLAQHFLPPQARGAIRPELTAELASRPWLGNVRELRNFVERAIAFGTKEALAMSGREGGAASGGARASIPPPIGDVGALPSVPTDVPFKEVRERWLAHLEREYIGALMAKHGRSVRAVADAAGLDPTYVYRLVKKHEL